MKPLFLTGFMGAGKSAVGRRLAHLLSVPFVDLDVAIEEEAGLSVTEIFSRYGEPHFRAMESRVLKSIAGQNDQIVATGGGVVIAPENRQVMKSFGNVINLKVSCEEVRSRLCGDTTRPLLQGDDTEARVRLLLAERELFYAEADLEVDTTGKSVDEVVDVIVRWLKREC